MNKLFLLLVLPVLSYFVWLHYTNVPAYVPIKPVQAVEENSEPQTQEQQEEAVKPPAPPDGEFIDIKDVKKEDAPVEEIVVQNATKPVARRIVASSAEVENKAIERKVKEQQNKVLSLSKEIDKEIRGAESIRQYIVGCQNDLNGIQARYKQQDEVERLREIQRHHPDRRYNIPDGESRRLIDRDWNNTNNNLSRAKNNLARAEKEIQDLKNKITTLK